MGFEASVAWLAANVMILLAPIRVAIRFSREAKARRPAR
jgi:hypothetical protein